MTSLAAYVITACMSDGIRTTPDTSSGLLNWTVVDWCGLGNLLNRKALTAGAACTCTGRITK